MIMFSMTIPLIIEKSPFFVINPFPNTLRLTLRLLIIRKMITPLSCSDQILFRNQPHILNNRIHQTFNIIGRYDGLSI
ncbi:hypothetical protein THIOM_000229 [Candidatus Thiomargarita nelsonii]|uniref:Uncharacterized protein n=1 Tax=Candidatus Thiomargarita nelsonii TaxID=1003181 RepID=A0A176S7H3_9GAMM|nr:hypothetical protein THIOM_000229 [Candidatus Thiomargarita nelsonii]